jgi:hypothetical protein
VGDVGDVRLEGAGNVTSSCRHAADDSGLGAGNQAVRDAGSSMIRVGEGAGAKIAKLESSSM